MDSGFARLAAGCRIEEVFGERVEPRAGALPSDALQADARAFHQEKELVGEALGLGVARGTHQRDQALALPALVRLDHPARRVARLGELDRGIGERAAAAAALDGELGGALEHEAQLRVGVARVRVSRFIPESFAFLGKLRKVRRDQLVLGGKMAIERHLVGAGGGGDSIHARGVDAVAIKKLARRLEDALPRWRGEASFQTLHIDPWLDKRCYRSVPFMLLPSNISRKPHSRGVAMFRSLLVPLLAPLLAVVVAACGQSNGAEKKGGHPGMGMPPPEVSVEPVTPRTLPLAFEYVGQTAGSREVEVRARVAGIILKRNFTEGAPVKEGESLYSIDPAPFEAALARAEADVLAAEARYEQAKRNAARLKPLYAEKAVSQKENDDAVSAEAIGAADVTAAKARLVEAKLNL